MIEPLTSTSEEQHANLIGIEDQGSANKQAETGIKNDNGSPDMARKIVACAGDNKFVHLCLYNSLIKTKGTKEGIEGLITIYGNLLGLHGFMAGFQYVALEGNVNLDENDIVDNTEIAIFSLRYFGFLTSLAGTLICIIIGEYLKTMQHENMETQVKGIIKYAYFIQLADYTALLATMFLAVASNLLLWKNSMPYDLAIIYNTLTFLFGSLLLLAFKMIIINKQPLRHIYDDKLYQKASTTRSMWDKICGVMLDVEDVE